MPASSCHFLHVGGSTSHSPHPTRLCCWGPAGGATLEGHGCAGQTIMQAAMTVVEMARVDASLSTFLMVHNSLCMLTIGLLGSERQRAELLPDLASLRTVGAPPQRRPPPPPPGPPPSPDAPS